MSEKDTLVVLGASYDSMADAGAITAVRRYTRRRESGTISTRRPERGADGKVRSRTSTRPPHATVPGRSGDRCLGAILPGIGLGVGPPWVRGSGPSRDISGGISDADLKELGNVLDQTKPDCHAVRDEHGRPDRREQGREPVRVEAIDADATTQKQLRCEG